MRYAMARTTWNIMKWLWPGAVVIFIVTYAANIAPLPAKQVYTEFYDSTFGVLFHPVLPLVLTLSIFFVLLILTFLSWLVARYAPEEETIPGFSELQQSHDNSAPTAQVHDSNTTVIVQGSSDVTVTLPGLHNHTKTDASSRSLHDKILRDYLDGVVSQNHRLSPTGIAAPSSQPLLSVNVPLDQVFIHIRAVSDRPRFGIAIERQQIEADIGLLRERDDLAEEEREELIQQLRAVWQSELVGDATEAIDLKIEDVFKRLNAKNPVAVILGGPGAGKSTTMRWLALQFARAMRSGQAFSTELSPAQFPLYVRISDYATYLEDPQHKIPKSSNMSGRAHLFQAFLQHDLSKVNVDLPAIIEEKINEGCSLLLLDGLDEVASDALRRQVSADIYAFITRYYIRDEIRNTYNRILISSRIVGYEPGPLSEYREYTLLDLTDQQIEIFLGQWCPAVELFQATRRRDEHELNEHDRRQLEVAGEAQRSALLRALRDNPGIRRLAVNPLMLTILALIQKNGGKLPYRRIDLYNSVTQTLLDNWNQARGGSRFSADEIGLAEDILSVVAYEMHHRDLALTRSRVDELARQSMALYYHLAVTSIKQTEVEQFIKTLSESSGLFVERGQGLYGFMHRTFQEYYAARYLLDQDSWTENALITLQATDLSDFAVQHYRQPLWHEPLLLAIAYKSEEGRSTRANEIIHAILNAPADCDLILQQHLRFSASCIVDCNPWHIDPTLQMEIATRLLDIYGDNIGGGRYDTMQREIEQVTLLWLRGQPLKSMIATPPLLAAWRTALCDVDHSQRQEGAAHLLASIATELRFCPTSVHLELVPPLLQLANVLDIPGMPVLMRECLPHPPARPATSNVEDYAFITLRLLDKDGPPGWLHSQWLQWAEEQPQLLKRLTQHSLEIDYLLTPAAFPGEGPSYQNEQHKVSRIWSERANQDALALQMELLRTSGAARYPYAFLYRQLLIFEAASADGKKWKIVWDDQLTQEMRRGNSITYQACFLLRLLLNRDDPDRQKTLVNELMRDLSSAGVFLVPSLTLIMNFYLDNRKVLENLILLSETLYLKYMRYIRILVDLIDITDLANLLDSSSLSMLSYSKSRGYIFVPYKPRWKNNLVDLLDADILVFRLCVSLLEQNTTRTLLLLALYSVMSSYDVISETLRKGVDQYFLQLEQQESTFTTEQSLLIEAINHIMGRATPLFPAEVVPIQHDASGDERARDLDRLNQAQPLSRADVTELLSACHDTRGISYNTLQQLRHGSLWLEKSVDQFAWKQFHEAWSMTPVAWQVVIDNLKDDDAYLCGAAALLLQRGKNVPPDARSTAMERIQTLLADNSLFVLPLDTSEGSWLRLDDVLFVTLQVLVQRG